MIHSIAVLVDANFGKFLCLPEHWSNAQVLFDLKTISVLELERLLVWKVDVWKRAVWHGEVVDLNSPSEVSSFL